MIYKIETKYNVKSDVIKAICHFSKYSDIQGIGFVVAYVEI